MIIIALMNYTIKQQTIFDESEMHHQIHQIK